MITPSINTALEPITIDIVRAVPNTSVHFNRIEVAEVGLDDESAAQFTFDKFARASALLVDARVQVVAWNGTSGSWMGIHREREICAQLGERFGVPFTTSTLAIIDALNEHRVGRFALAVPFSRDMASRIAENYAAENLTCVHQVFRDWDTADEVEATDDDLMAMLEDSVHPDAEAIVVVCTNIATAPLIQEFERRRGIPVFDSIAVTVRECLKQTNASDFAVQGWGRVLAHETGGDSRNQ